MARLWPTIPTPSIPFKCVFRTISASQTDVADITQTLLPFTEFGLIPRNKNHLNYNNIQETNS